MLDPEQQAAFVEELPDVFIPVKGGWGAGGATHVVLALANEDLLRGALQAAWNLRLEKNAQSNKKPANKKSPPRPRPLGTKSPPREKR